MSLVGILITALVAIISPLLLVILQSWVQKSSNAASAISRKEEAQQAAEIRANEKKSDYERQDQVAARADQRAKELLDAQAAQATQTREDAAQARIAVRLVAERTEATRVQAEEAARLLAANNELVAHTSEDIGGKLDTIHVLVNSNMTASMQSDLDSNEAQLVLIDEVIALRKAAGEEPSVETLATRGTIIRKIADLTAQLNDRIESSRSLDSKGEI